MVASIGEIEATIRLRNELQQQIEALERKVSKADGQLREAGVSLLVVSRQTVKAE